MNEEQIKKIDKEIDRLFRRKFEVNKATISNLETYIDRRIDSLKWVKENV